MIDWPKSRQKDKNGRESSLEYGSGACFWHKKNKKKYIAFLVFLLLLPNAVMKISELLYPSNDIYRNWQAFYAQEKNSIDLLIVGSSHAFSSFDVSILDEILGEKTYILASNSQTVTQSYYNIREVLKYQKPKMILLETFGIDDNSNWQNGSPESETYDKDWKKESNIDGMRLGLVKLEAIAEQYTTKNWPYAFLRIARSHQNWKDLAQISANWNFMVHQKSTFNGFRPSQTMMTEEVMQQYADRAQSDAEFTVCEENIKHFHMLADLCRKNGIRLLLVMAPMYDGYIQKINYDSWYERIHQLAEDENLEYIDCNMVYGEIGLEAQDFENAFNIYIHLNAQGAAKVTRYVVERIKE